MWFELDQNTEEDFIPPEFLENLHKAYRDWAITDEEFYRSLEWFLHEASSKDDEDESIEGYDPNGVSLWFPRTKNSIKEIIDI
jgi:hypothetical protein